MVANCKGERREQEDAGPGLQRMCFGLLLLASISLIHISVSCAQQLPDAPQTSLPANAANFEIKPSGSIQNSDCSALKLKSDQAIAGKNYGIAANLLEKASTACADGPELLPRLARAQMLSGQFDAAEKSIHESLSTSPNDVASLITAGELAYLQNRDSSGETFFKRAELAAPENPAPVYLLGRVYIQEHDFAAARSRFLAALAIDGTYFKAYDGLGVAYAAEGNTADSIRAYMKGVELLHRSFTPGGDVLYVDFAGLLLQLGSYQKAFDLAAEAAMRNPDSAQSFLMAGKALERAGALARSVAWFKQAALLESQLPTPHFYLAQVYRRLGEQDAAAQESHSSEILMAKAPAIQR